MQFKVTPVILPTPGGPAETVIISLPSRGFSDLRLWEQLGGFEPIEPVDSSLS